MPAKVQGEGAVEELVADKVVTLRVPYASGAVQASVPLGGKTELAECMKAFVTQNKKRGLVVVISDLYFEVDELLASLDHEAPADFWTRAASEGRSPLFAAIEGTAYAAPTRNTRGLITSMR